MHTCVQDLCPQSDCISSHHMRPRYLMYVYPSMYIKYVHVRACAPRRAACHAAIQHGAVEELLMF